MPARTISLNLKRVSATGTIREDISDYVVGGRIEMNTDRQAGKMSGSFALTDADRINPYSDFLVPRLTIEYDDGTPTRDKRLGFFGTRPAAMTRTLERAEATFDVEDLTRLMSFSVYTATDNVPSGSNVITEIEATMVEVGTNRYSFPTTSKTTPKKLTYPIGTSRLDKVNDLLGSIGWYQAFPRLDGRITSKRYVNLAQEQPVMTITDADVLSPIQTQINDQTLVNVVVVIKDDPAAAAITSIVKNTDPASPSSTSSVGFEYARVERVADLQSQTEADDLAARLLREARTYYQTASVRVWPDTDFGVHEVVDLALTGELAGLNGRWWVRRWSLGLSPSDCYYDLELNRITNSITGVTL